MLASACRTLLFVDLKHPVAHLSKEFQKVVMGLIIEVGLGCWPYI